MEFLRTTPHRLDFVLFLNVTDLISKVSRRTAFSVALGWRNNNSPATAPRMIVESNHLNVDAAVPTQHTCPSGRWAYSQLSPKLQSSEDSLQMNRESQIETGFGVRQL